MTLFSQYVTAFQTGPLGKEEGVGGVREREREREKERGGGGRSERERKKERATKRGEEKKNGDKPFVYNFHWQHGGTEWQWGELFA